MKCYAILTLCLLMCMAAGCYQIHAEDDLRTVPITNNPHNVSELNRGGDTVPALGY
jgi:hypothetical protein